MALISAGSSDASWRRSRPAGRRRSAATSSSATTAGWSAAPTTPAATGIARSARAWRAPSGSRRVRPSCCRCRTSTSSSPCRRRSAAIAFQNKRAVYAILFRAAAETLRDIAADPTHLGAEIGVVAVLHTWGQTLQHHPHLHCIVPGGGLSPDGTRWVACRPGFFLPVRVLSRLFRRLFLARAAGGLRRRRAALLRHARRPWPNPPPSPTASMRLRARRMGGLRQAPVRRTRAGAGLSRPLHPSRRHRQQPAARLADGQVSFPWKDYRQHGKTKVMTLAADEFIRRFLLHALPDGFHRIRHIGFLANGHRTAKLALCRALLAAPTPDPPTPESYRDRTRRLTGHALDVCPDCGGAMLERGPLPRRPQPHAPFWCDSS